MRTSRLFFVLLPAASLLTACSDSTGPEPSGSMSFTYQGSMPGSASGSFSVEGPRRPFVYAAQVTGAVAGRTGEGNSRSIEVAGSDASLSQDFSIRIFGEPSVGVLPTCEGSATDCVDGGHFWPDPASIHYFGSNQSSDPPYPQVTVTITEMSDLRVRGTFEGIVIGTCGTCADQLAPDTITISAGQFDVPFRQ